MYVDGPQVVAAGVVAVVGLGVPVPTVATAAEGVPCVTTTSGVEEAAPEPAAAWAVCVSSAERTASIVACWPVIPAVVCAWGVLGAGVAAERVQAPSRTASTIRLAIARPVRRGNLMDSSYVGSCVGLPGASLPRMLAQAFGFGKRA